MIESARFVNVNGAQVILNDDNVPFKRFNTTVEMRTSERNKGQRHGMWPARTYMGKRIFNCEGDLLLNTSGEYWQKRLELMNAFMPRNQFGINPSGTLYLNFTGINEELTSECTLDGYPELPIEAMQPARGVFMINLKAFDPKMYGEERMESLRMVEPAGRTYPKTYDIDYPDSVQQNQATLVNSGDIETYPIVRFYGPAEDPSLSIRFPSRNLTMTVEATGYTIPDGGWVDLDFEKPSALDHYGTNVYRYFVGSEWWALEPNPEENIVTYFASNWTAPARAVVSWRNAYML